MRNDMLTLFSWGYEGWGNATEKLVTAVDAVERSRGWDPPVFVDARARRAVRAEGFREHAFGDLLGVDRYRWMKGLGNQSILTGGAPRLVDPDQTVELLDLAIQLQKEGRRLIFFCSCRIPSPDCHRHLIAPALFEHARRRGLAVTVVEWPGRERQTEARPTISVDTSILSAIVGGTRRSVPLPDTLPPIDLLGLPWYSIVDLESDTEMGRTAAGPAQYRAGKWHLPAAGNAWDLQAAATLVRHYLEENKLLPFTA